MSTLITSVEDSHKKSAAGDSEPLKPEDYYRLIRSHLDTENEQMGQKLNWLVGSQSFLFIAYISLLNTPEQPRLPILGSQLNLFMWLTPIAGLAVAFFAYCGMLASNWYLIRLRKMWEVYPKDDSVRSFPPIQGRIFLRVLSMTSILIMPPVFIGSWIIALVHQVMRF